MEKQESDLNSRLTVQEKRRLKKQLRRPMKMSEIHFDEQVDITDVVCPVTFVKAKVALEEMDEGQVLAVKMNDGEPVQNVPRSIKEEGHQIF